MLLICGDFQALRSEDDYESLAVPNKFRAMESFYKYYKVRRRKAGRRGNPNTHVASTRA